MGDRDVRATSLPGEENTRLSFQGGLLGLITGSGSVAKAIYVILLFFSVVSWAIIAEKVRMLRRARRDSKAFLRVFRRERELSLIYKHCRTLRYSPLYTLFQEGYQRLDETGQATGISHDDLARTLEVVRSEQITVFQKHLIFLATTANVSPFFGLLGTVWGIMGSFLSIGQQGSASIAVVGPGIAEALMTTVAGLGAAIPAVIGYNYILSRIEEVRTALERVSFEFMGKVKRKVEV